MLGLICNSKQAVLIIRCSRCDVKVDLLLLITLLLIDDESFPLVPHNLGVFHLLKYIKYNHMCNIGLCDIIYFQSIQKCAILVS